LRHRISSDAEGDGTARFGLESIEQVIDSSAGHARRCGMRWRGTCARHDRPGRCPAASPGGRRTPASGQTALKSASGKDAGHRGEASRTVDRWTGGRVQGRNWTAKSRTSSRPAMPSHAHANEGVETVLRRRAV